MRICKEWTERFNAKWEKDQQSGCWVWKASLTAKGYGQIKIPGTRRQIAAHRLSYLIHRGRIPLGQYALHHCDNRACVNPDHLFLGTIQDNADDMVRKGRHCYGERQGAHKLTDDSVRLIHQLIADGTKQRAIAKMFCVAAMTISRIKHGARWAHLHPAASAEQQT